MSGPADGAPVTSLGEARRVWRTLPRDRRLTLERGRTAPADVVEAEALAGHARYLGSWIGDLEWVGAGTVGVVLAVGLMSWVLGQPFDAAAALLFIVAWSVIGILLRRRRANQLASSAAAVTAREIDGGGAGGQGNGDEFGEAGSGG
jgi:hypothetical protein